MTTNAHSGRNVECTTIGSHRQATPRVKGRRHTGSQLWEMKDDLSRGQDENRLTTCQLYDSGTPHVPELTDNRDASGFQFPSGSSNLSLSLPLSLPLSQSQSQSQSLLLVIFQVIK